MHPVDFSIRDDAVLALVRDGSLGGVWEQLRRNGRPTAAADIAASLGLQKGPAIAQLDRLVALGLAKRLPMSARRRQLSFEAISGQVIVRYRLPEDEELLQELVTSRVAHTLQAMPRTNGHDRTFGFVTRLTESEAQEVRRLLGSIADLLNGAARASPRGATASGRRTTPSTYGSSRSTSPHCRPRTSCWRPWARRSPAPRGPRRGATDATSSRRASARSAPPTCGG